MRLIIIIVIIFSFRRLNTLNKCASMKLDVNLPKRKVSVDNTLHALMGKGCSCSLTLKVDF